MSVKSEGLMRFSGGMSEIVIPQLGRERQRMRHKDDVGRYQWLKAQHHTLAIQSLFQRPEALFSVRPVGLAAYRENAAALSASEVAVLIKFRLRNGKSRNLRSSLVYAEQRGEKFTSNIFNFRINRHLAKGDLVSMAGRSKMAELSTGARVSGLSDPALIMSERQLRAILPGAERLGYSDGGTVTHSSTRNARRAKSQQVISDVRFGYASTTGVKGVPNKAHIS